MTNPIIPISLTIPEQSRLAPACEAYRIEVGHLTTFVDVGTALLEVRDSRLYRANYATFESYCADRWNMVASRARQLIAAANTVGNLSSVTTVTPANERTARELHGGYPPTNSAKRGRWRYPLRPMAKSQRRMYGRWCGLTKDMCAPDVVQGRTARDVERFGVSDADTVALFCEGAKAGRDWWDDIRHTGYLQLGDEQEAVKADAGYAALKAAIEAKSRIHKSLAHDEQRQFDSGSVATVRDALALTGGAEYQTIVIDPPWDWGDEGDVNQFGRAKPTYATMPIDEIAALPVGEIADDNAHLYLWITNRSLPKGFALLDAWGFRYVTMLTWVKPSFGMGNYYRGSTEQILFGVRGSLPLLRHDVGTHFEAPRGARGHSAKPDEFYRLVETCSPGPRIDMFARSERLGWTVWGNVS